MDTTEIHAAAFSGLREDRDLVPEDVEVVRTKQVGDDAVVAVTFTGRTGGPVRGFVGVHRREDGRWRAGGGWSSGVREVPTEALWVSRGGWQNSDRGAHGGWVNDLAAVAVRITTQDGRVVEDVVEDGIAMLTWRGPLATHDALVELRGVEATCCGARRYTRPTRGPEGQRPAGWHTPSVVACLLLLHTGTA